MIQTRTATHKNWSRGSDDEGPEGSSTTWDRKCDKTMIERRMRAEGPSSAASKAQRDGLSRSCHMVGGGALSSKSSHSVSGGLSRIKNALSRSVHGSSAMPSSSKPKTSNKPEIHMETSTGPVATNDLVNFAEHQCFSLHSKRSELQDRRSKAYVKHSFTRRTKFDELDEETDESSDEIQVDYGHHAPHKTASLRVLPQNPRPNPPRMCASMNDLGISARGGQPFAANKSTPPAFGRRDSLPPARYASKTRSSQQSVAASPRAEEKPLPVHLAAEKVANQKINLDRTTRRSSSPLPGRPQREEGEKKRRSSGNESTFNESSFSQLEKAFGEEDTLGHYFEMVKASPAKSPSVCGPRTVFNSSSGNNMVLPMASDSRPVFSPAGSPPKTSASGVSPKTTPNFPKLSPSPDKSKRPSLKSALAADDASSICAAQLEIPTAVSSSKAPLFQLGVQYNLYEQMKHSSLNLMEGSFVTLDSDVGDNWDLDQILTATAQVQ